MDEIEKVLTDLAAKATELSHILERCEKEVSDCCAKPLKDMSVSDKIELLLAANRDNRRSA